MQACMLQKLGPSQGLEPKVGALHPLFSEKDVFSNMRANATTFTLTLVSKIPSSLVSVLRLLPLSNSAALRVIAVRWRAGIFIFKIS